MPPVPKYKPPRDFPSMNAIHCVRGTWDASAAATFRGLGLVPAVWMHVGTIPGNSIVTSIGIAVSVAAVPTATLDVQFGETTQTDAIITTSPLGTPGLVFAAAGTGGYRPNRTRVFARINAASPLTAGQFNVLVQYYSKQD